MTREDKQLLLVDLCARLPYGVKIDKALYGSTTLNERDIESFRKGFDDTLKPYLRPMSSMTEEEKLMYEGLMMGTDNVSYMLDVIGWLNKNMFDYRGLIPKGHAISTEVFNPYKD